MSTQNNEYSFRKTWALFKASNSMSWSYLGKCMIEESYKYFADNPQPSALATIIYELRENRKFKKYARAISILCNIVNGEIGIETDEETKTRFYHVKLADGITPKMARDALNKHKTRFKTDFLNFVMSFRNEETKPAKRPFDKARGE